MKLLLIESQGKVEKLQGILGPGWKVAASLGHVCDLPERDIGVQPPSFKPAYKLSERGASIIGRLGGLCQRADTVYIGTDPDREGEAIAWHLARTLKLGRDVNRVRFTEITESVVRKAVAAPTGIDYKLVGAQEARRVLDRLVGYMVSPALSKLGGTTLSAGRVQSPAVALVVDREREIAAFKPTDHFGVRLSFADAKTWTADWLTVPDWASEDHPYFQDEAFAQAVADVRQVTVQGCEEGQRRRSPPAPLATSGLQQAASVHLHLDPEQTMRVAQKLYEGGHITYHRTDNPNISEESYPEIQALAAAKGWSMAPKLRKFKASEAAQAGHPAITPTHWDAEDAGDTEEEKAVYHLIRQRAIASQLADAVYDTRTAILTGEAEGRAVRFKAQGATVREPGWLTLLAGEASEDEEGEGRGPLANPVPHLSAGQALTADSGELLRLRTRAPKRYTKASLIEKLEAEGIGRPATYAAIMGNIERRGYVGEKQRFLHPSETAYFIVDQLRKGFAFIQVDFTREVEAELDKIAAGTATYLPTVTASHQRLLDELAALESATASEASRFPCPACGKAMRRIKGKSDFFWGCSGYPDCSETRPDDNGQPGEPKPPPSSAHNCPSCGKALVRRTKKGKDGYDFWGCSGYRDGCRASFPNKRNKPDFNPPQQTQGTRRSDKP
ncbi:MAG: type I DNA topoisomerase [Bacteroidetes bacterium]|nr:type I DNA topoisomerase [Bacteroidota bacterium]